MRIALVLGSGGARGYAHIPVINELKARGHEIVAIGGASMGALVGGFEAAGKLDDLAGYVAQLRYADVLRLVDPAFSEPGFIGLNRVSTRLEQMLGPVGIEDLPIPYTAVASDLINRREVWFRRGSLVAAIRASVAIPVAITPVKINGRVLVDGGLLNPLPLETVTGVDCDVTVAVSLLGRELGISNRRPSQESADEDTAVDWTDRVRRDAQEFWQRSWLGTLTSRIGRDKEPDGEPGVRLNEVFQDLPKGLTTVEVLARSLDAMQAAISMARTGANPPDVLISLPTEAFDMADFHKANEVMALGQEFAVRAFDEVGL